jgi:hypothetical protein
LQMRCSHSFVPNTKDRRSEPRPPNTHVFTAPQGRQAQGAESITTTKGAIK